MASAAAGATACTATAATKAGAPPTTARPTQFATTLTVNPSGKPVGALNDHYAGLSFESGTLAGNADTTGNLFDDAGNLPQLLKNLGTSVMRFGGPTVDGPSYTGISPSALAGLTRLANASGWSVLYSENLGNFNAAGVTADANAVATALGPRLAGIGCGNEPDGFIQDGSRPPTYTEADYLQEAPVCLAAIRAGAPSAPLEGADLTGAKNWLADYATQESGQIAWVGQHLYAAGCTGNYAGESALQADARLLSPQTLAEEVFTFKFMVADAKIAGARPLMSETNSICGGGLAGVSDSYASALWAIDYMLTGAEYGLYGMNFHDRFLTNCTPYSPLCPVAAAGKPVEYTARPIYYGMLFTHLLGTGNLLPVTVSANPRNGFIAAFALKPVTGRGLRLIIENVSNMGANVTLSAGGKPTAATVLHLTAPGLTATSGVRIQGAQVAPNGTIKPAAPTAIRCSSGKCPLAIPPYTADLVTIP